MVTIINLKLPASWTTVLPNDPQFDISASKLGDFLEAFDPIDWAGLNFTNVGTINGFVIGVDIGHAIEDEGNPLAQQTILNFTGAGVTASDLGGKTVVDIPSVGTPPHPLLDGAQNLDTFPSTPLPGSLIIGSLTPLWDDLLIGAPGFVLTSIAGLPAWAALPAPPQAGHVIENAGTPLTQQTNMNFTGAGVTASDAGGKTVVDIPGGGGGIDRELVANPNTDFYLYDEFFYPNPASFLDVHYEKAGTFSAVVDVIAGQVQFQTTAVANNVARINTCGGGLLAIDATKNWRYVVRLRQQTVTANTAMLISIYTNNGSPPGGVFPFVTAQPANIEIRADGVGNYFAKTNNGVTPNSQDTGVVANTAFHTFEIRSDPTGPNIEFLIDGNIVATFTTNLPTGNKSVFVGCQTGAASFTRINVDSLFLYQDR